MANTYIDNGDYYTGFTPKGTEFYFDSDDYGRIQGHNWILGHKSQYIIARENGHEITLKNLLYGSDPVGYIDGNSLNLRKNNIKPLRGFKNEGKTILNGYVAIYMPEHERAVPGNGVCSSH